MQTLPKITLHDPFLTMLIDNVCLAVYFLSYHTDSQQKEASTGVLRSTRAPCVPTEVEHLLFLSLNPSWFMLTVPPLSDLRLFFIPILSLLFALGVSVIPSREKGIAGPSSFSAVLFSWLQDSQSTLHQINFSSSFRSVSPQIYFNNCIYI